MQAFNQVYDYSLSTIPLFSFTNPKYVPGLAAPSFFANDHLTLPGAFGSIYYTFKGRGVITWHYDKLPNVYQIPSFKDLPFGIPLPSTILRAMPVPAL